MRLKISPAILPVLFLASVVGIQASASSTADSDRALRVDDAKFGVFVAGIRIGNFNLAAQSDGRSYGTSAIAKETGLASWLADFRYKASAMGWIRAGDLVPVTFEESLTENGESSSTEIKFRNGKPYEVAMRSESNENETPLDPLRQGIVLDPLTVMYLMTRDVQSGEVCSGSFIMFDGVRRSRLSLGTPVPLGDGFECRSSYERIEGWTEEEMNEQKVFPFNLEYEPLDGRAGWYRMVEISAPTSLGRFRVSRVN